MPSSSASAPVQWAFAGDKCVYSFVSCFHDTGPCATSYDSDFLAHTRPAIQQHGRYSKYGLQPVGKDIAVQSRVYLEADALIVFLEEGFGFGEFQGTAKADVVTKARMQIEWKMCAVHGHIIFHQCADEVAFFAHPRLLRVPEKAVMHEQQVRLLCCGLTYSGETGIHGGGDAADFAVVLHL